MKKTIFKVTTAAALSTGIISLMEEANIANAESNTVVRLNGENRYETASKISQASFDSAETIVIANAMNFADALSGVPLAYQANAPILLANGDNLRSFTTEEIKRLGAKNAVILGGEFAISQSVENELKDMGLTTKRLAGETRFETADIIANELNTYVSSDKAVIVDGYNFADAMSVAPFAAQEGIPIYLTRPNELESEQSLENYKETIIVGGTNAVSQPVQNQLNNPSRIAGINRYETNLAVLDYFAVDSTKLYIATGEEFADALTGSGLAAINQSGVALVREESQNILTEYLDSQKFGEYTILGGEIVVPNILSEFLESYLSKSKYVVDKVVKENIVHFKSERTDNNELPIGETNEIQKGENGFDEVLYEVTKINGKEINRVEKSRSRTDPVKEIVEIGTKYISVDSIEIFNLKDFLFIGEKLSIDAKAFPENATYKELTWRSNNREIATISTDGVITAVAEGTLTITIYSEKEQFEKTISIEVVKP